MTTDPPFVPNAIVETATPSAAASAAACSFGRPTVVLPSDRQTPWRRLRRIDDPATDGEADARAYAVPGDAVGVALRQLVERRCRWPPDRGPGAEAEIRDRLTDIVEVACRADEDAGAVGEGEEADARPGAWTASHELRRGGLCGVRRVGATSRASIDADTSIASTTVGLAAISVASAGRAMPTTSRQSAAR